MQRKLDEFFSLTQGNHSVVEYAKMFTRLSQYAGHHADTEQKRMEAFRRGLSPKLKEYLNIVKTNSLAELVDVAISQENCMNDTQAAKKCKAPAGPSTAPTRGYHIVLSASFRPPPSSAPPGR
jgi:hypothetical protein